MQQSLTTFNQIPCVRQAPNGQSPNSQSMEQGGGAVLPSSFFQTTFGTFSTYKSWGHRTVVGIKIGGFDDDATGGAG
jgi:hypothetical protein